jgi:hypothetical protein
LYRLYLLQPLFLPGRPPPKARLLIVPHIVSPHLFVPALSSSVGIYAKQNVSLREPRHAKHRENMATDSSIVIANLTLSVSIRKKKKKYG